jgi:hypothetical protein
MDRKVAVLLCAAIPLGLAGGYAWSAMTAPAPRADSPPKATITDIPDSPDEYPAALDEEWTNRADDNKAAVANYAAPEPEPSSNEN